MLAAREEKHDIHTNRWTVHIRLTDLILTFPRSVQLFQGLLLSTLLNTASVPTTFPIASSLSYKILSMKYNETS